MVGANSLATGWRWPGILMEHFGTPVAVCELQENGLFSTWTDRNHVVLVKAWKLWELRLSAAVPLTFGFSDPQFP